MTDGLVEINVKGRMVPSVQVAGKTITISGGWLKIARVWDEDWQEGAAANDPEEHIKALMKQKPRPDIFTFAQKLPDTKSKFEYHLEWDNVAAIPITSYDEWWTRLSQETRNNVRKGTKRGVVARVVEYDDDLVRGIISIHNDTPIRQGKPFAHYGKDFDSVKKDYGTYPDRSECIGAYYGDELVGMIKMIYVGETAGIMQILSKTAHYDKRPTNILIAKAVEVCEKKGVKFLTYLKYIYGNKTNNSLTEFKRRNGFEKIDLPRFYIPLTLKGRIAIKLKLHHGLVGILPVRVVYVLRNLRSRYNRIKVTLLKPAGKLNSLGHKEGDVIAAKGKADAS